MAGDLFGYSVALDGDTVVVGAESDDAPAQVQSGLRLRIHAHGHDMDPAGEADRRRRHGLQLGSASPWRSEGDTAVVGAIGGAEAAYVFTRTGSTWTQQAKLTAADGSRSEDEFGISLALSDQTLVVGAAFDDIGAGFNADQGVRLRVHGRGVELDPAGEADQQRTVAEGDLFG